jgi:hypothetical protein
MKDGTCGRSDTRVTRIGNRSVRARGHFKGAARQILLLVWTEWMTEHIEFDNPASKPIHVAK